MNRLRIQMHHTTLSTDLGEGVDVEKTASAIEDAVKAELKGVNDAHAAKLTRLCADLDEARGVLADQIIARKTLAGTLKAEDTEGIQKERKYLLGDGAQDPGLSTTRLAAELNRLEQPSAAAPVTQNGTVTVPGLVPANPFMPGQTAQKLVPATT